MVLRIFHIAGVATLVGSVFFDYFLLRPAVLLIPPPQAAVVMQKVGLLFKWLVIVSLAVVAAAGVLRLYYMGLLDDFVTLPFYHRPYGRWLAVMVFGWVGMAVSAAVMILVLQPILLRKLLPGANPGPEEVARRRADQARASLWMDRLILVSLIFGLLAVVAGASLGFGGLF